MSRISNPMWLHRVRISNPMWLVVEFIENEAIVGESRGYGAPEINTVCLPFAYYQGDG